MLSSYHIKWYIWYDTIWYDMIYENILHFLFFINIYFIHYILILYIMLYFVNNVNYWDSSSGQSWTGLLHQNELEQSWPKGSAQHDTEGGPQGRGGNSACPGCCHEKTGRLDKVWGLTRKGPDMAGHLDHGRTQNKVLDLLCLWCSAYSIEPPYLGDGETQLLTMWKASQPWTCPLSMPAKFGRWEIPVALW